MLAVVQFVRPHRAELSQTSHVSLAFPQAKEGHLPPTGTLTHVITTR